MRDDYIGYVSKLKSNKHILLQVIKEVAKATISALAIAWATTMLGAPLAQLTCLVVMVGLNFANDKNLISDKTTTKGVGMTKNCFLINAVASLVNGMLFQRWDSLTTGIGSLVCFAGIRNKKLVSVGD